MTKSQVQGFFSRLAASRRRQQARSEIEHNPKELFLEEKEAERKQLMEHISNERHCLKKSFAFLKYYLNQETGKKDLIEQLMSFIQECQCFNEV